MRLSTVQRYWDRQAHADPMWAILTDPAKAEGRWDAQEFFATGTHEVGVFMQQAEAWRAEEAVKFADKFPEWKDPKTYQANVSKVMDFMKKTGFEQEFLARAATEFLPIQIHDHRFQVMAWKACLYDDAVEATKQPSRAPVPPVQRPGSAPNRGEAQEARFKDLTRQLDRTGSLRDGAALIAARMNGRS